MISFWDYPLRREDLGKLWKDADTDQRREWRREGIVPTDYPEPAAADWPELLAIVEERVKPDRDGQNRKALRVRWWQYAEKRPGLYAAIHPPIYHKVIAMSRVGHHGAVNFLPDDMVYSDSLIVFPLPTHAAFCALQSRPHEIWARFFGSSMKDDLRYTPSDVFETFPFPTGWTANPALEAAGEAYYSFRADLMRDNAEGLTKTYNRFHDPDDRCPDVAELRDLHAEMDRVVLDAYGRTDIPTMCKFFPEHESDDESPSGRKRRRYRYRWPDPVRDEVLGRLIALNAHRAENDRRYSPTSSATARHP